MDRTDWQAYSAVYDMLLDVNPAYQDILTRFESTIASWPLPADGQIIDAGAGTGNFSLRWARAFPSHTVVHVDLDAGMNAAAEHKARAAGLDNLRIATGSIHDVSFEPASAAAISCVHALYAFPRPAEALANMREWLAPGGRAFLCDPGRLMDMGDWTRYIVGHLQRTVGPIHTARILWRGRGISRQNRAIRQAQLDGTYWMHSPEEFRAAVEAAGFEVEHQETCFRNYSDLVIARRPLDAASGAPPAEAQ